jgi:hypothetical protein
MARLAIHSFTGKMPVAQLPHPVTHFLISAIDSFRRWVEHSSRILPETARAKPPQNLGLHQYYQGFA